GAGDHLEAVRHVHRPDPGLHLRPLDDPLLRVGTRAGGRGRTLSAAGAPRRPRIPLSPSSPDRDNVGDEHMATSTTTVVGSVEIAGGLIGGGLALGGGAVGAAIGDGLAGSAL